MELGFVGGVNIDRVRIGLKKSYMINIVVRVLLCTFLSDGPVHITVFNLKT